MKVDKILNPEVYGPGGKFNNIKNLLLMNIMHYFVDILVKGILRQAMHEMPLLTMCTPFLIVGTALILYQTYKYDKADGNNRKYKLKYTREYPI